MQRNLSPTLLIEKFVLFQWTRVGKPQALQDINSFYDFKYYKAKIDYFCFQFSLKGSDVSSGIKGLKLNFRIAAFFFFPFSTVY